MGALNSSLGFLRENLKSSFKGFSVYKKWEKRQLKNSGMIIPISEMDNFLNTADKILLSNKIEKFRVGLVKDLDYLKSDDYFVNRADWPKYERFLKNNNICYSFFDIRSSNWLEAAEEFDIIIWHLYSSPSSRAEAESKIYFLEKYLKKICFPSFEEMWSYENKVRASYLYTYYGLPSVPTFITNSKIDAIRFLNEAKFPIISKITTGSTSYGVIKLKNKKTAVKFVNSCFSDIGRKTYWPFVRQKNYVYFQKFIEDAKYDLRIIIVGNKFFGYYRYAKKGDFRASGAGIVEKKALPEEAMRIALNAKSVLKSTSLAIDMVYSESERQYYIIETSIFFGIDTPEQLIVNGKPGYYEYANDTFIFKEGRFWIQELALQCFFNDLIEEKEYATKYP